MKLPPASASGQFLYTGHNTVSPIYRQSPVIYNNNNHLVQSFQNTRSVDQCVLREPPPTTTTTTTTTSVTTTTTPAPAPARPPVYGLSVGESGYLTVRDDSVFSWAGDQLSLSITLTTLASQGLLYWQVDSV